MPCFKPIVSFAVLATLTIGCGSPPPTPPRARMGSKAEIDEAEAQYIAALRKERNPIPGWVAADWAGEGRDWGRIANPQAIEKSQSNVNGRDAAAVAEMMRAADVEAHHILYGPPAADIQKLLETSVRIVSWLSKGTLPFAHDDPTSAVASKLRAVAKQVPSKFAFSHLRASAEDRVYPEVRIELSRREKGAPERRMARRLQRTYQLAIEDVSNGVLTAEVRIPTLARSGTKQQLNICYYYDRALNEWIATGIEFTGDLRSLSKTLRQSNSEQHKTAMEEFVNNRHEIDLVSISPHVPLLATASQ